MWQQNNDRNNRELRTGGYLCTYFSNHDYYKIQNNNLIIIKKHSKCHTIYMM